MRTIILFMNPAGMNINLYVTKLINKITNRPITLLNMVPHDKNNDTIITMEEYFDELFDFSERLTNTINDSYKNELIIISGFFSTSSERKYIYNAINRANYKIDKMYGLWIEDISKELRKNSRTSKELFDYLFNYRVSPKSYEKYTDIYYITQVLGIGTSKKHIKIHSTECLLDILAKECDNETN